MYIFDKYLLPVSQTKTSTRLGSVCSRQYFSAAANSVPVDPHGPWPSNWELSAYRATTVLRFLGSDGVPQQRMYAAGYGSTQPLVPDSNPAALSINRRVDIVVLSTASAEANALLPGIDAATHKGATP